MIWKRILTTMAGAIITGMLIFITTLLIEIRDNNKFLQPIIDQEQNESIKGLETKIKQSDSLSFDRDKFINNKCINNNEIAQAALKKSDSTLLYTKYNTIMIQQLIRNDKALSKLYEQLITMK